MKKVKCLLFALIAPIFLAACSSYTRTETDVYTIALIDTTKSINTQNAPGNRDNGIVYPSSKAENTQRVVVMRDSTVERDYPAFIRLGLFESIGTIGGNSNHSAGMGMFGIFPDFNHFLENYYLGEKGSAFTGGIYRIGIGEWRLRWFRDAKDWTLGCSVYEFIIPDARSEKRLQSFLPLYVRKRFFLWNEIPYITFTTAVGFGWTPSQYINMSGSLDIGSIGGLNLRAYLGLAAGYNSKSTSQVTHSTNPGKSVTTVFPYFGLGVSFLDFFNKVEETKIEWKDHPHSSWDIGLAQFALLKTGANNAFSDENSSVISGYMFKIANASVALPLLEHHLYAGTSLLNVAVLGANEWGVGIMPIRLGYWQTVIADELSTEPFIEYNYYPSSFIHIGNRLNLRFGEAFNFSIIFGYINGSTTGGFDQSWANEYGNPYSFSRAYIGISFGIFDRIFFPEDLRYNK